MKRQPIIYSPGFQEQTIVFRQALASAVAKVVGWRPELKSADLTLSAHVKEVGRREGLGREKRRVPSLLPDFFHPLLFVKRRIVPRRKSWLIGIEGEGRL